MKSTILVAATASLLLVQCSKEEQNQDNLQYQLSTTSRTGSVARINNQPGTVLRVQAGTFSFTSGTGNVNELKFEVKDPNTFVYKSNSTQSVNLFTPTSALGGVTVPPGTYEKVEFKIRFEPGTTAPAFELIGTYTNSAGVTSPMVYRVNTSIEFKFEKKTPTAINAASNYTVAATLALNSLFLNVSEAMMNAATRDGSGTILISATSNQNIYNSMWGALEDMLKVEIK